MKNVFEIELFHKKVELVQDPRLNSLLLKKIDKRFSQEPQLYITANTFKATKLSNPLGKLSHQQQPRKMIETNRSFINHSTNQVADTRKETILPIEKSKWKGRDLRSTSENPEYIRKDFQERSKSPLLFHNRQSVSPEMSKAAIANKTLAASQHPTSQILEEHSTLESSIFFDFKY